MAIVLAGPGRADPIDAEVIRSWSKVPFEALDYGAPADGSGDVDPLALEVVRAAGYVARVTGRVLDALPDDAFVDAIAEAIQMRTEQQVFTRQEDSVESGAENDLVSSFAAGRYNESRRSLDELRRARMVNAWPALHRLLWDLMTDERRDAYNEEFDGEAAGAMLFVELPGVLDDEITAWGDL